MSTIFPGNYVTHLNAYRGQSVFAIPGIKFYQVRGAACVYENVSGSGSLELKILSPDLRQDDKPRQDRPFVVPAGATIYRSAVTVTNLSSAASATVAVDGTATATSLTEASTAADSAGAFPAVGASSDFALSSALTAESGDATISVAHSAGLSIVDAADQAAVIVEVCYFVADGGPSTDEINLPYKTESGSGY